MLGNGVNLQKKKYSGVSLGWNSRSQKCFPLIRNFHLFILPEYLANLLGFKEVFQLSMLFLLSLFHLLRLCFNWVCSISLRETPLKIMLKGGSASFTTESVLGMVESGFSSVHAHLLGELCHSAALQICPCCRKIFCNGICTSRTFCASGAL